MHEVWRKRRAMPLHVDLPGNAAAPASLGGLGRLHAERISHAAYWAAWRTHCCAATAVSPRPVTRLRRQASRLPQLQTSTSTSKAGDTGPDGRRVCAQRRCNVWANGWRRDAALALHTSFRERVLLPAIQRPSNVPGLMLRSLSISLLAAQHVLHRLPGRIVMRTCVLGYRSWRNSAQQVLSAGSCAQRGREKIKKEQQPGTLQVRELRQLDAFLFEAATGA